MSELGYADALDFLTEVEEELAEARERAVRALDRADALAALHAYVREVQDELQRPVSASDVFDTPDEAQRARLAALAKRITDNEEV